MPNEMEISIRFFQFVVHSRDYSLISNSHQAGSQMPTQHMTVNMQLEMSNEEPESKGPGSMQMVVHVQTNSHLSHALQRAGGLKSVWNNQVHIPSVIRDPSSFDRRWDGQNVDRSGVHYLKQQYVEDMLGNQVGMNLPLSDECGELSLDE